MEIIDKIITGINTSEKSQLVVSDQSIAKKKKRFS